MEDTFFGFKMLIVRKESGGRMKMLKFIMHLTLKGY